jgi:hypothetical protein
MMMPTPSQPDESIEVLAAGSRLTAQRRPDRPVSELWLSASELASVTGWILKPEGLCREDACVPLSPAARSAVHGEQACVSDLWRELGRPVLSDEAGKTWLLGEGADDRKRQLESLRAPDFTLPDIEGKLHSLSDYRGQKVLLATWASW